MKSGPRLLTKEAFALDRCIGWLTASVVAIKRFRSLCFLILCGAAAIARGELAVSNHESGSTVRYPVVLLRGTLENGEKDVEIRNAQARECEVKAAVNKRGVQGLGRIGSGTKCHWFAFKRYKEAAVARSDLRTADESV